MYADLEEHNKQNATKARVVQRSFCTRNRKQVNNNPHSLLREIVGMTRVEKEAVLEKTIANVLTMMLFSLLRGQGLFVSKHGEKKEVKK